jgi:hypothetical protein
MVEETAHEGWDAFCKMTGMSPSKAHRKRAELLNCGAIFYMYRGRPPRKRLMFFPSIIKRWLGLKASKGEIV